MNFLKGPLNYFSPIEKKAMSSIDQGIENIFFSFMCVCLGEWKVLGWKTHLFGWKEKWNDRIYNLYKFTIISLLNKTKSNTLYFGKYLAPT